MDRKITGRGKVLRARVHVYVHVYVLEYCNTSSCTRVRAVAWTCTWTRSGSDCTGGQASGTVTRTWRPRCCAAVLLLKVLARLAAQRDARARLDFRDVIGTFDPQCLLFIDESHHDRKNARRRRGRARRGKTPSVHEVLGGPDVRFSLLAAMNSSGFVVNACRIRGSNGAIS